MSSRSLDELLAYVGLDAADAARLRALHPLLAPHFASIADRFYAAIVRDAGARAVLTSLDQTPRLHAMLIDWMATGLLGPYDEQFYAKRSRIGRRHVEVGLPQQYMFVAMNIVRAAYQDLVTALVPAPAGATARAVDKLLDIELAIMVRHYQLDSEERLVASERRIQADKLLAMQTLSGGLAHEIRNPLNSAKLQLELLDRRLRRQHDDPRLLEPSQRAQSEIARLTALLDDFLAFVRPNNLGAMEHDVTATVRNVIDLEREVARRRDIEIELVSPETVVARIDPSNLQQIVIHLTRNAIEASDPGDHVLVEVVEVRLPVRAVEVRITDSGPGIPDEVRERIYEPFFSMKEGGTGLGMSIVHSLVNLMHGTIDCATGPRGTRFCVRIPAGT